MISILRELPDGIAAYICGLRIIEGGNLLGNIMNPEKWIDLQKLTLDRACDIILQAEVGSKGNERHLNRFVFKIYRPLFDKLPVFEIIPMYQFIRKGGEKFI